jgi:glycosyltransferase involved in cell wall biosynthesis
MKIGYVIDRCSHGWHDFVLQEILELESRGIDTHIFSLGRPDRGIEDVARALDRLRGPIDYCLDIVAAGEADDSPSRANDTSGASHWIAIEAMARGIEHLHAHGAVATEVARETAGLAGLGYSFTWHADSLHGEADLSSLRESILEARFVVAQSDFDRTRLLEIGGSGAAHKLHGIRPGVNPDEWQFSGTECRESDSILAMGPLIENSGFADLIDAVGLLRDRGRVVRLTIIGQGEFETTLRAQADVLGLADNVRLIGGISRLDLAMLMRMHAVIVFPLLADDGDRDAMTDVVLEAMSVGLVVVSTDLPGIRELIEDGVSGRVVSHHYPRWLAGALETLLASPDLRDGMARRARSRVEDRFTASHNAWRLAKLFFEAVAKKRLLT